MYHSITFGDKNTWDDWKIVPSSRPVFSPPKQKTTYLEIPGADGSIDISTALTGYPVYENRTGSFEFLVMNDYPEYRWEMVYSNIMVYLHGQAMKAILEDDPNYYYEGRFSVDDWSSEKDYSKIKIGYNVGPYKWSLQTSTDPNWLWDPFNFVEDYVSASLWSNIPLTDSSIWVTREFTSLTAGQAPICPIFTVDAPSTNGIDVYIINGTMGTTKETHIPNGTSYRHDIMIFGGDVTVGFKGIGTVSVEFRKGRL